MLLPPNGPVKVTACMAGTMGDRQCRCWHTRQVWIETLFRPKGRFQQMQAYLCPTHRGMAFRDSLRIWRDGRAWGLMSEAEVAEYKQWERTQQG